MSNCIYQSGMRLPFAILFHQYETKILNNRYDFPHLRIPVMTFIMPFPCKETSSFKYLFRCIMILIEIYAVYIKIFDYKGNLYSLKCQELIGKFEDLHIFSIKLLSMHCKRPKTKGVV